MDKDSHQNPNVSAVLDFLNRKQIPYELRVFDASARSASQAAALIGCPLGAIVKSLVFEKTASGQLLLALVSGQNRADIHTLSELAGKPVRVADPQTVLARTGYPVGAVPPCGLPGMTLTIIDADLMHFQHVWASAGAVNILLKLNPAHLSKLEDNRIEEIKQG